MLQLAQWGQSRLEDEQTGGACMEEGEGRGQGEGRGEGNRFAYSLECKGGMCNGEGRAWFDDSELTGARGQEADHNGTVMSCTWTVHINSQSGECCLC